MGSWAQKPFCVPHFLITENRLHSASRSSLSSNEQIQIVANQRREVDVEKRVEQPKKRQQFSLGEVFVPLQEIYIIITLRGFVDIKTPTRLCAIHRASLVAQMVKKKKKKKICLQCRRPRFDSWVVKFFWRRKQQPTPVFLPGEFYGQKSLASYYPWGRKELEVTEQLSLCTMLFTAPQTTGTRRLMM